MVRCLLLAVCAVLSCGCASTKYIPVESVRTEYLDRSVIQTDSQRQTASEQLVEAIKEITTITLNENGDTTRTDREYRYMRDHRLALENDRLKSIVDSLQNISADTIRIPYPVEKTLTGWQQVKLDVGGLSIGGILAVLFAGCVWMVKRFRNQYLK